MIDWVVDHLLGSWGRVVVDAAVANALPLSIVVIAYGAVLLVGHRRLRPYQEAAIGQVARILPTVRGTSGAALHEAVGRRLDWDRVAAVGPGRYVVGRWRLWPSRASAETLPKLLPLAELCRDAAARRAPARDGSARRA